MRSRAPLVSLLVLIVACSAGRVATWEKGVDTTKKGDDTGPIRAGDDAFKDRGNEASLRKALASWEQAADANPGNAETLTKLARGYYFLADGYLAFDAEKSKDQKQAMLAAFEKGLIFAERALMILSPPFAEKMKAKTDVKVAVDVIEKNAAGPLYWYATNLAKWARAKGITTILFHKERAKKAIEHVVKIDPNYWHGGPDRYLGAFYSVLSGMMGGDVKKSKQHFDRSLEIAPAYLGTKYLLAETYYGKRAQNRKLFEDTLNEILKANPDVIPEIAPEQRVEQRKAAALLKNVEDIF